ncbi:MAG TPA: mechanosensitive ion channel domain-containing protein [Pyrinomonadaceae bacterium]|nr:mechanosensitive ion channel domain-containing protein [Pyrinomonadaceae bacterium]
MSGEGCLVSELLAASFASVVALLQEGENVLERLARWTEPLRAYINYKWRLADFEFSVASMLVGLFIFLIALLLARRLRTLVERRMQAQHTQKRLDPGLQYAVLRLVNYVIIVVGALYAMKTAFNLDLTSLAVIFTALSVGIGFGLQFIAGDIASGFILLFERPVKVGDFLTVSGPDSKLIEGRVESINLRTTIVMTNDRVAAIVPNSRLVNNNVLNWSYRERRSRISVRIGVSYETDVELVTETLLRAAEGVEGVLGEPPPSVQFTEFGESALNFRLLIWTDRPRRYPQIRSDINYRIRKLFLEEGIEIASPQLDLNLRSGALRLDRDSRLLVEADDESSIVNRQS